MEQSIFENVEVVAKLFYSKAPSGKVQCISRSMGKLAIVENNTEADVRDKELWHCKIIKEIHPGQNRGAFIIKPLKRIEPESIKKLIPGFYTEKDQGNALILTPKENKSDYWVLSRVTRSVYTEKYSIIVVPIGDSNGEKQTESDHY